MTKKSDAPAIRFKGFSDAWEQRKVQDVADRFDNLRIPVAANLRVHGTTPYYGANGIQDYVEGFTHDGEFVLVAEDGANDLKNYPVKCVNGRIWVNNHAHVLQGKAGISDNSFLAFAISQSDIESLLVGGSRAKLNAETLMSIEFKLPCLQEQYRIGEYLTQLDHLITLHQRKFEKLTNVKKSMLEKMFPQNGSSYPEIRFKGFTDPWEQRKLSEITDKVTEKNAGLQYVETFTNSAEFGIISQRDFFDHDIAKLGSLDGYYIVKNEDFVYNPRISTSAPVGPINRNKLGRTGVMSPLYTVFRPHDIDTTYLEYFFKCGYWHSFMNFNGDSGARSDRFSIRDNVFFQMPIPIPDIDEQRKIGELLTCLDNLITLHQRKCANLCSPSQVVFSLLFATSTFSWEQRKLGDIASDIVAGGDIDKDLILAEGQYPVIANALTGDGIVGYYDKEYRVNAPAVTVTGRGDVGHAKTRLVNFTPVVRLLSVKSEHDVFFLENAINTLKIVIESTGVPQLTVPQLAKYEVAFPRQHDEEKHIGAFFKQLDHLITLHQRECISFTGRADRLILTANKKRTTSSWEQRKLGELVDRVVRKNINNESTLPLTISAQYGLVDQITYFNNRVASRDVSNYYLVLNGEFAYNKSTSDGYPFGAVKRLDLYEKGVLSTLYIVFAPKKEQQIDSDYLTVFFDTDRWHKGVAERAAEGARNHGLLNISAEDFFDIDLSVPKDIVEQKQIGAFIRQLDHLITLHQRKPFLMKWRTSDANRNQTNRLVL